MANFSPTLANYIARWLAGTQMPLPPALLWVSLWDGDPLNGGIEVGQDITGDEGRVPMTVEAVPLDGESNHLINEGVVNWGASVSVTDVDVTHVVVSNDPDYGQMFLIKQLGSPKTVSLGDIVRINDAALDLEVIKFGG